MDIQATINKARKGYKAYLREAYPDWADSTVNTHAADALSEQYPSFLLEES